MSMLPLMHRQSGSCAGLAIFVAYVTVLAPFLRGAGNPAAPEPLRLHPENAHYLLWKGRPTVLITAGEHDGPGRSSVSKWRAEVQADFAARMERCKSPAGPNRKEPA